MKLPHGTEQEMKENQLTEGGLTRPHWRVKIPSDPKVSCLSLNYSYS